MVDGEGGGMGVGFVWISGGATSMVCLWRRTGTQINGRRILLGFAWFGGGTMLGEVVFVVLIGVLV